MPLYRDDAQRVARERVIQLAVELECRGFITRIYSGGDPCISARTKPGQTVCRIEFVLLTRNETDGDYWFWSVASGPLGPVSEVLTVAGLLARILTPAPEEG